MSAEELAHALDRGSVLVTVKPSKRENRIVQSDPFTIEIAAPATEGAANRELVRYLKRIVGPCKITSGAGSRTKRIERVSRDRPSASCDPWDPLRPLR